jgi:hypothetical protein
MLLFGVRVRECFEIKRALNYRSRNPLLTCCEINIYSEKWFLGAKLLTTAKGINNCLLADLPSSLPS